MAAFLSAAAAAIGSSSIGSALVRILVAYGISRLINKANDNGNDSTMADTGVRLQAAPDTTNPIPLVYGSAYLGGKITDAFLTNENKTMWYCLTITEVPHETTALSGNAITTSFGDIFLNGQQVYFKADGITVDYVVNQDGIVDTSARDLIKIYLYKRGAGNPTLPQYFLDLPTPPALPGNAFDVMPNWDTDFKMRELAFALVRVDYNRDKGITGLPDIKFQVANTLYRPGDAIYSYLINEISGGAIPTTAIDTASLLALNDYADDTVEYYDESDDTIKTLGNRYQINGVIDPKNSVLQNLQRLAANTGCFVNYDIAAGKWGVVINRDQAVSLHFDDSNIISGIDLTGTSLDNMYNSVEVQFPHRELRDQMDTIRIDLPAEFLNANEPPNVLRLTMDLLNEPLQARELGYLELYQNRMDRVVTFTTDYSKINTEAGDIITITSDVYGWTTQPFRVMRVREVEGEDGGLAVEITAQEYDSTMYTAGGQPRRPRVPTEPIEIPAIGVIGTPATPTITVQNSVAVPAVVLNAIVPSGLVDRMEYWYSSDAGTTWLLGDTDKNANGAPFNQGSSSSVRLPTLIAGTYQFKVRAGNESAFGEFSTPTTAYDWEPVQVTDQVTDQTKVDTSASLGDLLPVLGMGALAYLAYKTLYPELLAALSQTDLGKLLGIQDPAEIAAAQAALEKQSAAFRIVNAGNASLSAGVDDTLTFTAGDGIEFEVNDVGHEIIIKAIGGGGTGAALAFSKVAVAGQPEIVADKTYDTLNIVAGSGITIVSDPATDTITITNAAPGSETTPQPVITECELPGSVFPTIFGEGTIAGVSKSRLGIFTHDWMVFGGIEAAAHLKSTNICDVDDELVPHVPGVAANHYSLASFYDWTYNSSTTNFDRGAFNSQVWLNQSGLWTANDRANPATYSNGPYISLTGIGVRVYYSTCDYDPSKELREQAWSDWKLYYYKNLPIEEPDGSTNPDNREPPEYRVDRQYEYEGVVNDTDGPGYTDYDAFVPDLPKTKTVYQDEYWPELPLKHIEGKLIAFGASPFKFGGETGADTSFAGRTIWGYVSGALTFHKTLSFKALASNGTMRVGIANEDGKVYYSDDGINWVLVEKGNVTFNGGTASDTTPYPPQLVVYGDSKFYVFSPGNSDGCAISTDGISWTEYVTNLNSTVTSIAWSGTKWTAIGPAVVQQSDDGITWTTI